MARKPPQRTYTRQFNIEAPYAKEFRTLLEAVAKFFDVEISDAPRAAEGQYRRGTEVSISYRRRKEFDGAQAAYDAARDRAQAGLKAASAPEGEDVATFKSSWLYGYAIGVAGLELDEEKVSAAVRKHINGSGAWDGYQAARNSDLASA